jgi:hypothetical protein
VEWATPSRIALWAGFRRIAAATDMTRNHFKDHPMQEPNTPEEIFELHKLRRADPQRFLQIVAGRKSAKFSRLFQAALRVDSVG